LILTNHYERPFKPDFGGNLSGTMFELATENTAAILQYTLKELLVAYEPRIIVDVIEVFLSPDKNALEVAINYSIKNTSRVDSVNLILKRTR
jgi:phage baseplate assembly protein W